MAASNLLRLLPLEQMDSPWSSHCFPEPGERDIEGTEDPEFGPGTAGFFRSLLWELFIPTGYLKPLQNSRFLANLKEIMYLE